MVGIPGINNRGDTPFLAGLNGFINGKPIGNRPQEDNTGLFNAAGKSLAQRLGLNLETQQSPAQHIGKLTSTAPSLTDLQKPDEKEKDEESKKKDRLEASNEGDRLLDKAVEQALANGTTQQIIVSEDGRFEATIDLQLNQDGSYELGLAVRFAESKTAALQQSQSNPAQSDPDTQELAIKESPTSLALAGADALVQRDTSFEQILQTRGFEANIFFEEAKTIAVSAEQAFGAESGNQLLSVAGAVAQEFTLNVSIKGDDLSKFNEVADQLVQFDDSGTLSGFLDAVQGVLNTDSSNLGALVDASHSLLNATQEHIGAKLSNFFAGIQDQFGGTLEELGFDPKLVDRIGEDVQNDLNTFFDITNNLFSQAFNSSQIGNEDDVDNAHLEALDENMKQVQDKREELFGESLPPRPDPQPLFQNELPPKPDHALDAIG